jgi:putative ABC transport system substrate-binding protein
MSVSRRRFAIALAQLAAAPLVALSQPAARLRRVGILASRPKPASVENDPTFGAFVRRMRELGYVDGRTITLDWRFADGKYDRLPGLAREFAAAKVDVIVAATPPSVEAARAATSAIPIRHG